MFKHQLLLLLQTEFEFAPTKVDGQSMAADAVSLHQRETALHQCETALHIMFASMGQGSLQTRPCAPMNIAVVCDPIHDVHASCRCAGNHQICAVLACVCVCVCAQWL